VTLQCGKRSLMALAGSNQRIFFCLTLGGETCMSMTSDCLMSAIARRRVGVHRRAKADVPTLEKWRCKTAPAQMSYWRALPARKAYSHPGATRNQHLTQIHHACHSRPARIAS
jgi:hypothetical protein